jgi:hypothetical protein
MAANRIGRPWTPDEEERAKAMYLQGASSKGIAKALQRPLASIDNKLNSLGVRGDRPSGSDDTPQVANQRLDDIRGDERSVVWTTSSPVRTEADALAKAEIDQSIWEVDRCVINSWEVGAKNLSGIIVKTPLWQVKLWLKRKRGWSPKEFQEQLIAELIRRVPRPSMRKVKSPTGGLLYEISIMDHHFGKLAWAPEVGENYDVKIAEQLYMQAAHELLEHARQIKPALILFVVGNDFYHVDSGKNQTTSGTPLEADGRWQKSYVKGAGCVLNVIDEAVAICKVHVVVVCGNHDTEKTFTLGVLIETAYRKDGRVTVDNSPSLFKAFPWGTTLLVFYHGHNMSRKRLELLPHEIQDRYPELYAKAKWREIHTGHIHSEHERVWFYRTSESFGKTIHRVISSLCGTDAWHDSLGYRSLGAAEAHMYDSERGRVGYWVSTNMAA